MTHRRTLDAILTIVVGWAVLFTVPFFITQIAWPWNLRVGIVVTAAVAVFSVFYFYPSVEKRGSSRRVFQTFYGGDELLKELERVGASCTRLLGSLSVSGERINPELMEINDLWLKLDVLRPQYSSHWSASVLNRERMVADELRKASTTLSERDLDQTRAHIDGAAQNTQALIAYLKAPPSS